MTNLWMKLQLWDNKPSIVIDGEADQEKAANEINQPTDKDQKKAEIFSKTAADEEEESSHCPANVAIQMYSHLVQKVTYDASREGKLHVLSRTWRRRQCHIVKLTC